MNLPETSQIQVLQDNEDGKLLYIPPGGKAASGIGCFAIVWNSFMLLFTPIWFVADVDDNALYFLIPFLGLFWAVGLGFVYAWVRMSFTRTYILLETDQLSIQRVLFGRRSVREILLGINPRAELTEAYSQNDVPVYTVTVRGLNKTAKFATALSQEEKDWLVDTINEYYGADRTTPAEASGNGTSSGETVLESGIPNVAPSDIPLEMPIVVQQESADQLTISYPVFPKGVIRNIIGVVAIGFGLFWMGTAGGGPFLKLIQNPQQVDVIFGVVGVIFSLAGLVPITFGLGAFIGKTTIDITIDRLRCRWHVGPFGYSKWFPVESITNVIIARSDRFQSSRQRRQRAAADQTEVCFLQADGQHIPLTTFHELAFVKTVAGLVRYQLTLMGIHLQDD